MLLATLSFIKEIEEASLPKIHFLKLSLIALEKAEILWLEETAVDHGFHNHENLLKSLIVSPLNSLDCYA